MEFENRTPIAARIDIGATGPDGTRRGLLIAKATYRFDALGRVSLDDSDPYPLRFAEEATPLGLIPKDDVPRTDDVFEVFLLGSARAPAGVAVPQMTVALSVGGLRRELIVTGDRHWLGEGESARISSPEPFVSMPVTWSRAFGGRVEVEIDEESYFDICDDRNDEGTGFDPAAQAAALGDSLRCPKGYPKFERRRHLPNIEAPDARVTSWTDAPAPEAWAPLPPTSSMHFERALGNDETPNPSNPRIHDRAYPAWVLPAVPLDDGTVVLEGFCADGRIAFELPRDRVGIEYVLGARTGVRWATPHALVLLADERRFTIVHRLRFAIEAPRGDARRALLQWESGVSS